jgi:hypothetical protein
MATKEAGGEGQRALREARKQEGAQRQVLEKEGAKVRQEARQGGQALSKKGHTH